MLDTERMECMVYGGMQSFVNINLKELDNFKKTDMADDMYVSLKAAQSQLEYWVSEATTFIPERISTAETEIKDIVNGTWDFLTAVMNDLPSGMVFIKNCEIKNFYDKLNTLITLSENMKTRKAAMVVAA